MEEKESTAVTSSLLFFLAGALIGAGVALLYAPKTGREVREKASDLADDAVGRVKEFSAKAQEKMKATYQRGKETMAEEGAEEGTSY